jgi:hypothetical protein
VDCDDAAFVPWHGGGTMLVAHMIEDYCISHPGVRHLVACVEPPPSKDRWLIAGIDGDIRQAMARKPGAYDIWGRQRLCIGPRRAIDTWRGNCNPDLIVSGTPDQMSEIIHAAIRGVWP